MKCLMLIKHAESYRGEPIPQALMDAMGELVTEGFKSGVLKDTAGLKPTADGFRVRLSKKQLKLTDGPFTETKEQLGGFYLVECADLDKALEYARQLPLGPGSAVEVRPVVPMPGADGPAA